MRSSISRRSAAVRSCTAASSTAVRSARRRARVRHAQTSAMSARHDTPATACAARTMGRIVGPTGIARCTCHPNAPAGASASTTGPLIPAIRGSPSRVALIGDRRSVATPLSARTTCARAGLSGRVTAKRQPGRVVTRITPSGSVTNVSPPAARHARSSRSNSSLTTTTPPTRVRRARYRPGRWLTVPSANCDPVPVRVASPK